MYCSLFHPTPPIKCPLNGWDKNTSVGVCMYVYVCVDIFNLHLRRNLYNQNTREKLKNIGQKGQKILNN